MMDFLAAIDKRSKPVADIEQGYISTAACILANMSMQARAHTAVGSRSKGAYCTTKKRIDCCDGLSQTVDASGSQERVDDLRQHRNAKRG